MIRPVNKNDNVKYILYYTPFWNHKDFKFGFGQEPFQVCPYHKTCVATDNQQLLESTGDFGAVIFHSIDFNYEQQALLIQKWRRRHQRFVYFNAESPETFPSTPDAPGFYNWTMTYRHDSDIVRSYGWFEERNRPRMYPPPLQTSEWPIVYDEQTFLKQDYSSLLHLAKRPKKVAWVVSNCDTASRRDDYVRELRKYIEVDIFGKCGSKTCDVGYQVGQNKFDNCTLALRDYKFYLSFENSLCSDYVTEKFFSRVNQLVVIVMGGTNYSQVAPPHSYINVMDYASPRELANYLLELDRNDSLYLSYFWWKQYYRTRMISEKLVRAQSFCQLCDKLHSLDEPTNSYASLREWWTIGGQCGQLKVPGMPPASPALRVDWNNR